mmetsp:Transcript_2442/g.4179  ORF Transcript_2442/g.4179 Transcript_2442/m.4179 type:complete len:94 (-) Transcript_2442:10-291(-)
MFSRVSVRLPGLPGMDLLKLGIMLAQISACVVRGSSLSAMVCRMVTCFSRHVENMPVTTLLNALKKHGECKPSAGIDLWRVQATMFPTALHGA